MSQLHELGLDTTPVATTKPTPEEDGGIVDPPKIKRRKASTSDLPLLPSKFELLWICLVSS